MPQAPTKVASPIHPFRRAILRGLAVILPPLLTVLVFLWAWGMIDTYILTPSERIAGQLIVWSVRDIKSGVPDGADVYRSEPGGPITAFDFRGSKYVPVGRTDKYIPESVQAIVDANPFENKPSPQTAGGYYEYYVQLRYLRRSRTVPLFLALFLIVLYLTGKFMAAGVGRFVWRVGEGIVHRMPIVRNVYSAVKQITDYFFSEHEVQFLRVVAVEWPRKGLWTIAFVTGESFRDIKDAAGEPILSLLVPTSPMPATGFTCTVLKAETIELDITVDQAVQFIVSCGVVVPPHQQWASKKEAEEDIRRQVLGIAGTDEEMEQSA
ncbi:MAG TPA: DUF502 domain-containing protein [Pirellulaceae bacterium]|nr:DUF502 domain-containing protein [Pirellulaceae bacterium]